MWNNRKIVSNFSNCDNFNFLLQKASYFHPIVLCNYLCVDGNVYVILWVFIKLHKTITQINCMCVYVLVLGLSAGRAFRAFVSISNRFNRSIEFQNKFNFVSANIVIMNHNWMWWCLCVRGMLCLNAFYNVRFDKTKESVLCVMAAFISR